MNESSNKYFIKNTKGGDFQDITTLFDGVGVLKVDGMLNNGKPINIYTAQWVDSQFEDYMITTTQDGEPKVVRENPDISITFIVRQTYAVNPIDVQTVHDDFVGYLTGSDVWIRSDYSGGKIVHGVCLEPYEPTTVSLQRGLKSYIMGTIKLHSLGSVFDYFVSTSLRRVTLSHQDDGIVRNHPYSNSLVYSSDNGLVLVTITMGGTDITSTAYNHATKEISIPQVTGNIVISAESSPKIVFADQNVKSLCVSNWGGNYLQNEITEYEAAQVTSLNGVFRGNTNITSFDELRYFMGITEFALSGGQGEFYNCTNLVSIVLPQATVGGTFPATLFYYCTKLAQVDLSPVKSNAYTIYNALRLNSSGGTALIKAILPSGTYSGSAVYSFYRQKGITTIEIKGTADWSGITSYNNAFNQCIALSTIIGTIVGISQPIDLHWSPLTRASALVLLNGLATVSTQQTITFSASTYATLTQEDIAIATNKNWQVASA